MQRMAQSPFDLTGRVALVTGAYRGLGFAIARGMAEAGAVVVLNGRKRDELAQAAQSLPGADVAVFDVTKRDAVTRGVHEAIGRHAPVGQGGQTFLFCFRFQPAVTGGSGAPFADCGMYDNSTLEKFNEN